MEPLNSGDIVKLKSGGPGMVVHSLDGIVVTTTWFNRVTNEFHKEEFSTAQLTRVPEDEGLKGLLGYPSTLPPIL
jgi:uncharacterized protein YodC (DUF2158 family)